MPAPRTADEGRPRAPVYAPIGLGRVRKPGKLYGMSTNDATIRHDLTDRQWARLAPLLPPQRPPKGSQGGKPFVDHRRVINGLLWPAEIPSRPWRRAR